MSETFKKAVQDALARNAPLGDFVEILREHHDLGLSAKSAAEALEQLRSESDEQTEDRILEIMDIVAGFCGPQMRVWKTIQP